MPDAAGPLLALAALDDAYGRCWISEARASGRAIFANARFAAAAKPPKFRSVPKWMLQIVGIGMPLMREVAEMYYLFDSGFVLDDTAVRQRLGEWKKTPFPDGIAQTLAWTR